jgi:hypothetical protein
VPSAVNNTEFTLTVFIARIGGVFVDRRNCYVSPEVLMTITSTTKR